MNLPALCRFRGLRTVLLMALIVSACSISAANIEITNASELEAQSAVAAPDTASPLSDPLLAAPVDEASGIDPAGTTTAATTAAARATATSVQLPSGFSSWNSPTGDPIQLIKRTEGYQLDNITEIGERLSGNHPPLEQLCHWAVPTPAGIGSHQHDVSSNPLTKMTLYLHDDATAAASYAADIPGYAATCPAESVAAATTYIEERPSNFGIESSQFRAWTATNGDEGLHVVTTHHGAVSVVFTVEQRPARDADEFRSLLMDVIDLEIVWNAPAFAIPDNDLWASATEAEDFFIADFMAITYLFTPDDLQCIVDELAILRQQGDFVAEVITSRVAFWCAPGAFAESSMRFRRELATPIDDMAKRRCFLHVVAEFNTRGTFDEFMERVRDLSGMDPYGADRAVLDARLLAECGIDEAEGVVGGLDPRAPLDASAERAPFCAAMAARSIPRRIPTSNQERVDFYQAFLDAEASILPPPSIVDLWERRQRHHAGLHDLYLTTGKNDRALYSDIGLINLDAEVDFAMLERDFSEYMRINCPEM